MVKGIISEPFERSDPVATFQQHAGRLRAMIQFVAENQPKKMETRSWTSNKRDVNG